MNAPGTMNGQDTVVRFIIQRVALVALAVALILGLYPALLQAIAPATP
jgi:hypothetical protein